MDKFISELAKKNTKEFSVNEYHDFRNKKYAIGVARHYFTDNDGSFYKFDTKLGDALNIDFETQGDSNEYADGGGKVLAKLKKLKSEMKQIWEETGEQYSDKKEMLMSAGYDGSDANDLKHEEWKNLGNDVQIKLINDYFAYYEQLAVYVQGVGSIYNGTSMQTAVNKAKSYLKNNPKAEIVISDEKYGDTYDLDGYMIDDEYAEGGVTKKRRRSPSVQYGGSDRLIDKQRSAKPVGYRFTDTFAKKKRRVNHAIPKKEEIKQFLGKGIYKESRRNRSDISRKIKL